MKLLIFLLTLGAMLTIAHVAEPLRTVATLLALAGLVWLAAPPHLK